MKHFTQVSFFIEFLVSYSMFLVIERIILWKNIQFGGKMLKNSLIWYLQIDDKLC